MHIGYARVSTQDQRPELQLDALAGVGCEQVFQEKVSGKNRDRPELDTCLKVLRKGDTLVVTIAEQYEVCEILKDRRRFLRELVERALL